MEILLIVLFAVAALAIYAVLVYNRLVSLRTHADEGWSGIDVQLNRRHDLIPNLVSTVKGYVTHERQTLEAVTEARAQAEAARTPAERGVAEAALGRSLMNLYAVAENYPDLKASASFLSLQQELSLIEAELQAARRYYNATVRDLNVSVDAFPSNLVARRFVFEKKEFFELDDAAARQAPAVSF